MHLIFDSFLIVTINWKQKMWHPNLLTSKNTHLVHSHMGLFQQNLTDVTDVLLIGYYAYVFDSDHEWG